MELYSMGPSVLECLDPLVLTHEGASLTLERRVQGRIIWLLLWLRAPLPPPSQPLQTGVGRPWKTFH